MRRVRVQHTSMALSQVHKYPEPWTRLCYLNVISPSGTYRQPLSEQKLASEEWPVSIGNGHSRPINPYPGSAWDFIKCSCCFPDWNGVRFIFELSTHFPMSPRPIPAELKQLVKSWICKTKGKRAVFWPQPETEVESNPDVSTGLH